jgi:predicted dehydrogenase
VAAENKLVTQMGTQIHAGGNYRRVVELVQSGAIGPVREVHVWLGANFSGPARRRPAHPSPTRPTRPAAGARRLDWDLWLGPAAYRPYHSAYAPFGWRYWWNFANGQLGDFFCHYCDLAFWALDLRHPTDGRSRGAGASGKRRALDHRPAGVPRARRPAAGPLHWYNGGPYPELVKEKNVPEWGSAVLFIGSKGMLITDYGKHQLLPEDQFADFQRPSRSFRIRSAITASGSKPARRADRPPATSTTPAP